MKHLQDIADLAEELCDAHQHRERRWTWDKHRNRKPLPDHVTTQAGLITQLHEAVQPGSSSDDDMPHSASGFGSRPPLALEALSRYTEITIAALKWCWDLRLDPRDTTEASIRALVGAAGTLDMTTAARLRADMRRWRTLAAVYTGWMTIVTPRAACPQPDCGQRYALRVNLTHATAICTACEARWDRSDGSINLLAAQIAEQHNEREAA